MILRSILIIATPFHLYRSISSIYIYFEHPSCRHVYTSTYMRIYLYLSIYSYIERHLVDMNTHLYPCVSIFLRLYTPMSNTVFSACKSTIMLITSTSAYIIYIRLFRAPVLSTCIHINIHVYLSISAYLHVYRTPSCRHEYTSISMCIYLYPSIYTYVKHHRVGM